MPLLPEHPFNAGGVLYRKFFDSFADELYVHDAQGLLLDANQAACANLGYPKEKLLGMHVADISAHLNAQQLASLWRSHPIGSSTTSTNSHRRKDGSTYQLEVRISCESVDGKKYFLAAARRSEAQLQREKEILQLNERLHALVDERTRQWQASSSVLNAVSEQTPDAIFIKDMQGRYQYVNRALSEHLGRPVNDILGLTDADLYPAEQAIAFAATDQQVLHQQQSHVYEARMHNGQSVVFANTMKAPYRNAHGQTIGILGITRNVTDVRNAQEQTAHNYEMLCQAERIAKVGSWRLDLNTQTFTASDMLNSMNGRTPQDPPLTPDTLATMIPPDQHALLSHAIAQCIAHGTPYTVDVSHKRPGGGAFPARIRGQAFRDAQGNIVMLHGTLQDLSDHVEADQRLQNLADNLPNGAIFRCAQLESGHLSLHYVSAGIQHLTGIAAHVFLSEQTTFSHMIVEADRSAFKAQVKAALSRSTPFECNCRLRRADGHIRWMHMRAVPRQSLQGMVWEGILLDVTAEHEAQAQLRAAKEAAEAGEQAKADFLATMSHEIRTPMNTVIGMTQLLQQTPLAPKQRNYLDKVSCAADSLLRIINDILDFSKLEAETTQPTLENFTLEALLQSISAVTGLRAEQQGIEVVYDIAPNVPHVLRGDLQRLRQVLTNLVDNAIKFTDRGEVVIRIHAEAQDAPSNSAQILLHVNVRDTGIGIAAEHMDSLFQPFTQAEAHIRRRFGGTGLGLAICQKLVHHMGGTISASSQVGVGSEFQFHIPLQSIAPHAKPAMASLQHCRVMVVDDNAIARQSLATMVQDFGMHCDSVENAKQALQRLQQAPQPYHLLLLDWQMPHMNGLELAQRIRTLSPSYATPAMLMVTAFGREAVEEQAKQLQLQGLLTKPVTASTLLEAIQNALFIAPHIATTKHPRAPSSLSIPATLRGHKVLVVDDNAFNREVAQDFLELAGIAVTSAHSGLQALRLLEQQRFDAVLLDVQMPEMDGFEVIRRIRQQPHFAQLPVWALTAQARAEDRAAILASGMDGHITKPIDAQRLYCTLANVLTTPAQPPHTPSALPNHAETAAKKTLPQQARFSTNSERMQRLLGAFVRDFAQAPSQIRTFNSQQAWGELGMLAHTLKGALGYLDQPQAMHAMQQLESQAQQAAVDAVLVDQAAAQLQEVLAHITTQLKASHTAATAVHPNMNWGALAAAVEQSIPAIRRGDYAGVHLLEPVEQTLRGNKLHALAARALALAEDLEREAACECLLALQQALLTDAAAPTASAP